MGEEMGFRAQLRRFRLSLLGSCQSKRRPANLSHHVVTFRKRELEEHIIYISWKGWFKPSPATLIIAGLKMGKCGWWPFWKVDEGFMQICKKHRSPTVAKRQNYSKWIETVMDAHCHPVVEGWDFTLLFRFLIPGIRISTAVSLIF